MHTGARAMTEARPRDVDEIEPAGLRFDLRGTASLPSQPKL